jgi:hypothetical protein
MPVIGPAIIGHAGQEQHRDTVSSSNVLDSLEEIARLIRIADMLHRSEQAHQESAGQSGTGPGNHNGEPKSEARFEVRDIWLRENRVRSGHP